MKTSPESKVRDFYDATADGYAQMMDAEIELPMYADLLGRLADRVAAVPGPILDTSCGSGHVLARYREMYDAGRPLRGVDLSPRMVALAGARLSSDAKIVVGDMRELGSFGPESSAAVLSFFALHHLDAGEIVPTLKEWHRVTRPQGQLLVATWEGCGPIDYGEESDVVAFRYTENEIREWAQAAGFAVDRCWGDPVEGFPMDAVYLEGTRE